MTFAKGLLGAIALSSTPILLAQTAFPFVSNAVKTARDQLGFEYPGVLHPASFSSNEGEAQSDIPPSDRSGFRIIRAPVIHENGSLVDLSGGVEFEFRGYRVTADQASGDLSSEIFEVVGHVKLMGKDATVTGDQITVDFQKRTYVAQNSHAQFSPGLVGGGLRGDLFVSGETSYGSNSDVRTFNGGLTTCDLPKPHYEIESRDSEIKPGDVAILRKVSIYLFSHCVFTLPYLIIPLNDRSYNDLPDVGVSTDEGWYVKGRFGIPLRGGEFVGTHEDILSKLGLGLGGEYLYHREDEVGHFSAYRIFGNTDTTILSEEHHQKFNWGTLSFQGQFQHDDYLTASQGDIGNAAMDLAIPSGVSNQDRISLRSNSSSTQGFSTLNQSASLSDVRQYGGGYKTNLGLTFQNSASQFDGGTNSSRQELDVRIQGSQDFSKGTAQITYLRAIPIGQISNFYGATDITPEITLSTDSTKLSPHAVGSVWPWRTSLSFGQYHDPFSASPIQRASFDFNLTRRANYKAPWSWTGNTEFRQGFYSDGTAQYLLSSANILTYKEGERTNLNFRYGYVRPYGFSPLSVDQTGQTNYASTDLSYQPIRWLSFGAQSGYDLLRLQQNEIAWQPVGVRVNLKPTSWLNLRSLLSYDTFNQVWSNLRFDLSYRPGATSVSIGARYDGIAHSWADLNGFVNGFKWGKSLFSAYVSYNGYLNQIESAQLNVTYDLHCAEAVLSVLENNVGFRTGTTIQLAIRLKALPFMTPFGSNSLGGPLGTGTGRSF